MSGNEGGVMIKEEIFNSLVFSSDPFSRYTNNMKCKKCGSKIKLVFS